MATHPVQMIFSNPSAQEFVDTPFLDACPYLREVIASVDAPVDSVRLMRLTPGSQIHEHTDPDLSASYGMARLHVPITTNPGVEFLLNGVHVPMSAGELWYLRLSDPHSVANRGTDDRVHLVIDARVDERLLSLLASSARRIDDESATRR